MATRVLAICAFTAGLAGLLACTDSGPEPTPGPASTPASTPAPSTPSTPAPVATVPAVGQSPACSSDLDCHVCASAKGCMCDLAPAGSDTCPDMLDACVRDPCSDSSASCWDGKCKVRPALAGPCQSDAECEVRDDACLCDLFAALKTAPADTRCQGRGCGGRPAKNQYQARCDVTAGRCVLERGATSSTPLAFTLKLACEMHGAGISRDTLDVTTAPGAIRFAADGAQAREAALPAADLQPLAAVLDSPGFAAFVAEAPTPGVPHPGMTYCTLDVQSDRIKVTGKRWMMDDTFTPEADAGRQGLQRELAALRAKLPARAG